MKNCSRSCEPKFYDFLLNELPKCAAKFEQVKTKTAATTTATSVGAVDHCKGVECPECTVCTVLKDNCTIEGQKFYCKSMNS